VEPFFPKYVSISIHEYGGFLHLRPRLLAWYFTGWERNFLAHSLILDFPNRPVYFSGILEFHPGPSREIPSSNPRQSGVPTRDPYLAFLPGRKASDGGDGADADLGTPPMNTTYRGGSYFSPVSSRASSPLLP
jgi:hypothetical protein